MHHLDPAGIGRALALVKTHAGSISDIDIAPSTCAQADAVSEIIRRNLLEVNSKDYSPETVLEQATSQTMLVAIQDGRVVGTASYADFGAPETADYYLRTVFVLPELHRRGIGTELVKAAELGAQERGAAKITVPASITAKRFYEILGYCYKDGVEAADDYENIIMVKRLI